jgi:DNA ligase-1
MRLADVVATSRSVARASARLEKIELLAALLSRVPPHELDIAIALLSGTLRQGRVGLGGAVLYAKAPEPSPEPHLEIGAVDLALEQIKRVSGSGAGEARARLLAELLARATRDEQAFLVSVIGGELRQGALEGVLVEAVARAARLPAARIRRASMLAGGLIKIGRAAILEGATALDRLEVQPFHPLQPMLADAAPDLGGALDSLGEAVLEYKLDGARIQVHKADDEVRIYSRSLREVTDAVPEVVDIVRQMQPRSLILDGEVVAFRADGRPHPFQVTMRRFGRRLDVKGLRQSLPLSPSFFDCLYVDGQPVIDEPLSGRAVLLARAAPARVVVPRLVTADVSDADAFLARALAEGHEGLMAKAPASPYAAGRRGQAWLKIKQPHTLDLVILAVEWGSGRRRGTLSNLHVGARDGGGFVMLGKTFKGLTDDMLAWQTKRLLELEVARDRHIVVVRPELVVEIAFDDIQESSQYPGRLALRFARVRRHRPDKAASSADTFEMVQALYQQMTGLAAPARRA